MIFSERDIHLISVGPFANNTPFDITFSYIHEDIHKIASFLKRKIDKEVVLSCKEIKFIRNILTDTLREVDDFEFHAILGFTVEECCELLGRVKKEVDIICYPK